MMNDIIVTIRYELTNNIKQYWKWIKFPVQSPEQKKLKEKKRDLSPPSYNLQIYIYIYIPPSAPRVLSLSQYIILSQRFKTEQ